MPPKELPGFYYDADKNRYFPIRGPIPGAAARRPSPSPPPPPDEAEVTASCRKRARQSELLHARELYGGGVMLSNNSSKSTFRQQWQYAQAAQPMAWKYQGTALVADRALEELRAVFQTPSGLIESKLLVTGSTNGAIKAYGIGDVLNNFEYELEFLPEPAWTPLGKQKTAENSEVASIWSSGSVFTNFSSSITCIKTLEHNSNDGANTNLPLQRALWLLLDPENPVVLYIL